MNEEQPEPQLSTKPKPPRAARIVLRAVAWTVLGLISAAVAAVAILTLTVNIDGVHRYLLHLAQREASQKLGVAVTLQNFSIHFSTLSVDLYGLTVNGAAPYPTPPLLQIQHLEAGVRIVSLFQRKWYLDKVEIDRPVAWIVEGKNGASNIPKLKGSGQSKTGINIFDLGIRRALLDSGEVYFNDRPRALAADLHDLEVRAAYSSLHRIYSGTLAYKDGLLDYGSIHSIPHRLNVSFTLTPESLRIDQATLASGASSLAVSATLTNYSQPQVYARYKTIVDGEQVGQLMHDPSVPAGLIEAAGTLQYQRVAGRPLLASLTIRGDMTSRQLGVRTGTIRAAVENIAAHYTLGNGNATLADFRASLFGGEITAHGTIQHIGSSDSHAMMDAAVHGVSLADLDTTFTPRAARRPLSLRGIANATATASWGNTLNDLVAHTDVTIGAQVAPRRAGKGAAASAAQAGAPGAGSNASVIPVQSEIHATYARAAQSIEVNNSYVRLPQTSLTMNGTVGKTSSLALDLQANDLGELASIANLLRKPGQLNQSLNLAGKAAFQGKVSGSASAPQLTGQLTATNLRVDNSTWKAFRAGVALSPSEVRLENADLEPASHGRITLSASAALQKWSFSKQSPIEATLHASGMKVADLLQLAGKPMPVTGTLNASVQLHGSVARPEGSGSIALREVTVYQQPVKMVKVTFSGAGDQDNAELSVKVAGGSLQGKVSVQPDDRTYTAQVTSSGIKLERLSFLKARNIPASGAVALSASGRGTFANPQANANVEIQKLTVQHTSVTGFKLGLSVANHVANAQLASSVAGASLQAKAQVHLSGDYLTDASIDTQRIPLQTLLAAYAPGEASGMSGATEVHATLQGPLKDKRLLQAAITIPYLNLAYNNTVKLAATEPIRADYKNGVLDLQPGAIQGTDTNLQFQGSIPVMSPGAATLQVLGTVDLQLAQLFKPDLQSSGALKFNIRSGAGGLGGQIDIVNAKFATSTLPVGLQNGNGTITLTNDRVTISRFQGTVGGGTVTAQGGVTYRPKLAFDLAATANGIRVLYPQGVRETIDANLRFAGSEAQSVLGGSVNLADVSFTPGFDLSSLTSQFSSGVGAPTAPGMQQNIALNIAVNSTNSLSLQSRTLSVDGTANLMVQGTASHPVILGRVDLTGGNAILNGDRFQLTGGTVQFVNPSETRPVVHLALSTTIQQYDIDIRFNGPVDQMRGEYTSNPALPQADIISLLAFGKTTEASAANPTPANQAAESLIASQVSSQVTSRLSRVAGISQLSISPVLAGNNSEGPPGAVLTIRQQVTGNLYVTFSTNVASTQDETIQGDYKLSPRVSVSATRDPNGGFAVDMLIKKSW